MRFPLFFPTRRDGWHPWMLDENRKQITADKFYGKEKQRRKNKIIAIDFFMCSDLGALQVASTLLTDLLLNGRAAFPLRLNL
jgi:hypothetical protein